MAYIGKTPTIGNFQVCDAISVVNGQAAYTMQVGSVNVSPESANHMLVSLNGILQKPGSSFTVSGSTITFASNLVTGDVIDFIQILGNVLDLGVPSDNTVSLAKLTASGTKSSSTFLRGDNTFASVSVNNGLELLATTTISSDASISFDSSLITDTYKSYKLILQNIRVATDNVYILVQVSSDNGSNYITSGYSRMIYYILSTGSPGSASGDGNKSGFYANGSFAVGNDTGEGLDSDVTLFGLRSTTTAKTFIHQTIGIQNNGVPAMEQGGFILPNTTAMNNIKIYASSGNLASGEVKLYGFS